MHNLLVIRFGALGDLCLLGWTLARLATAPGRSARRVTLVTKARFAELAGSFRGVDDVVALADCGRLGDLVRLAAQVRARPTDTVIDAHAVLRSRLLLGMIRRTPRARLRKDTAARLRLLRGGPEATTLSRHMRDRFDELLAVAELPAGPARPPLMHLADDTTERRALGLAPGAQWDTKRWPVEHFATLIAKIRTVGAVPLRVYLGPREADWFDSSPLALEIDTHDNVELVRDRSLVETARSLAGCRALVTNDSGLMHLAEAVGTPTVALFGPTVRAFGYAPHLAGSTILEETDLVCRPCSRNGKRPCHRGDLACLQRIDPDRVWQALVPLGPWQER